MARTSPRRWTLLPVMLTALLAKGYGGHGGDVISFRRGPGGGRLWRCPKKSCRRVERTRLPRPRCSGTPEKPHDPVDAEPLPDDDNSPTSDDLHLFGY